MNLLNFILIILFILPLYYIGLYFLFNYVNNRLNNTNKIQNSINKVNNTLNVHEEKITNVEKEVKIVKEDLSTIDSNLDTRIESTTNKILTNSQIKLQEMIAQNDIRKLRNTMSIEIIEEKINKIIRSVLDNYIQSKYLHNREFAKSDGTYDLPDITDDMRRNDINNLFLRFINLASHDVVDDLSFVYNIENIDFENFMKSEYIAPKYNEEIRLMYEINEKSSKLNNHFIKEDSKKLSKAFEYNNDNIKAVENAIELALQK